MSRYTGSIRSRGGGRRAGVLRRAVRRRPLLTNTAEGRLRRQASRGGDEGEWAVVAVFPHPHGPPPAGHPRPQAARLSVSAALPGGSCHGRHAAFPPTPSVHHNLGPCWKALEGMA